MAEPRKKISAASARAHTRRKNQALSTPFRAGITKKLFLVFFVGLVACFYMTIQPPPASICGSSGGPPVTSPRIKLRDGRYLSYLESGVLLERAKYKVVYFHGFGTCKHDLLPFSKEVSEELGIYYLSFDRPGYGESDPHPKRTPKSFALDVEDLADQIGLGLKFYVIGFSMGGEHVWTCLKYIPNRLAGAALLAPVSNFWWPGFPSNISKQAYNLQLNPDKWAVRVAHYAPWLTYWWNAQKYFPSSSVVSGSTLLLSSQDKQIIASLSPNRHRQKSCPQGVFECIYRDMIINFGSWDFGPLDLHDNPLASTSGGGGAVHLWHGAEDLVFPPVLSRYIAQKLHWIHYHEIPDAGHLFPLVTANADAVVKVLTLGDPPAS